MILIHLNVSFLKNNKITRCSVLQTDVVSREISNNMNETFFTKKIEVYKSLQKFKENRRFIERLFPLNTIERQSKEYYIFKYLLYDIYQVLWYLFILFVYVRKSHFYNKKLLKSSENYFYPASPFFTKLSQKKSFFATFCVTKTVEILRKVLSLHQKH